MALRLADGASPKAAGGIVEHCQTSILERNQSVHRALSALVGKSSSSPSAAAAAGGGGASQSGGKESGIHDRTGVAMRRSQSVNASSPPHPTDSSPLLPKHPLSSSAGNSIPSILEYYNSGFLDSTRGALLNTIRFQVVIWHIGQIDMVQGRVPVTFRLTVFWNASKMNNNNNSNDDLLDGIGGSGDDAVSQSGSQKSQQTWRMLGRQQAFQADNKDIPATTVDIPAVSILNVVTFDTIGEPEISMLREDTKLMRWSCMYRATLCQDHWEVEDFPHDEHEISLRLAILAHRQPGSQWDRRVWKLALATADDSQGSVRVPHGLVVDQVSIPEFRFNKSQGLSFDFIPLDHGPGGGTLGRDTCLEVKLKVLRNSSYYDRNIMPLLGVLNFVAITITALEADTFFERALLTLNIAFVEIGMRMTVDSKLPTASYQIKMQRILNEYFFGLLFLVLESMLVYELHDFGFEYTVVIDWIAAIAVFSHNAYTLFTYYADARRVRENMFGDLDNRKLPR